MFEFAGAKIVQQTLSRLEEVFKNLGSESPGVDMPAEHFKWIVLARKRMVRRIRQSRFVVKGPVRRCVDGNHHGRAPLSRSIPVLSIRIAWRIASGIEITLS